MSFIPSIKSVYGRNPELDLLRLRDVSHITLLYITQYRMMVSAEDKGPISSLMIVYEENKQII